MTELKVNSGRRIHVANNLQARLSWGEAESVTDHAVEEVEAALLAIYRASPSRGTDSVVAILTDMARSLEQTRRS